MEKQKEDGKYIHATVHQETKYTKPYIYPHFYIR